MRNTKNRGWAMARGTGGKGRAGRRRAERRRAEKQRTGGVRAGFWAGPGTRRPPVLLVAAAAAVGLLAALFYYARADEPGAGTVREFTHVHGLAVDPHRPEVLYVATHRGLVRVEGGRWIQVGRERHDLMGFNVSPAERDVLYASGHPGPGSRLPDPAGFIASRDGGRTWEAVSLAGEVDFHVMTVSGADPRLIYGWFYGDGMLYRSEDGGRTWTRLATEALLGREGRGPFALAAHPGDRSTLLAAADVGLLRSEDLGATWTALLDGVAAAVAPLPADPEGLLAYVLERGLLRSRDGGATWTPLSLPPAESDAVGFIAPHPTDPDVFYVATFAGSVLRTPDGGTTWETLAREGRVGPR